MKKLLIITGPQGSGNHMWSKIFALHPEVYGWQDILETYWIGHDQEPFAPYWKQPLLLSEFDWSKSNYYVASVSIPYMDNGTATIPNFKKFMEELGKSNIVVQIAVLGRDQNILRVQQERVREQISLDTALEEFSKFVNVHYLSFELLHLYREKYLDQLSRTLDFPIGHTDPRIENILITDSNTKYFTQSIAQHWVDDLAKQSSRKRL
jgi:hypothetical protein